MIGDRRNRLLNGLTAAGVFVFVAVALWLFAVISSWSGDCPHKRLLIGGLDKGISAWPPAAQCFDSKGDLYYWQAQPWVKPLIVGLLGCAFVIVVALLVAVIRERRGLAGSSGRVKGEGSYVNPAQ
jgi:hypothetical protein